IGIVGLTPLFAWPTSFEALTRPRHLAACGLEARAFFVFDHRPAKPGRLSLSRYAMPCSCVVGLQWGDEAKGKIVDLLTEEHDFVVRYNGGANAGHTVVSHGKSYKFSLLPTGVLRPGVKAVIANGVVVYPPRFFEEIDNLR